MPSKADFIGSIPFAGHGTKTFLSADVPFEGFAGNFFLEPAKGTICMQNGVVCFTGNITSGDAIVSGMPYSLRATVRTWPMGMP